MYIKFYENERLESHHPPKSKNPVSVRNRVSFFQCFESLLVISHTDSRAALGSEQLPSSIYKENYRADEGSDRVF